MANMLAIPIIAPKYPIYMNDCILSTKNTVINYF